MACNTEVHIQLLTPTKIIRLRTRLIGVDPNISIILELGSNQKWQQAMNFITKGQEVIVRIVNTDDPSANVLAFRSKINTLLNNVGRLLVLYYPKELQKVALRQHSRIPINVGSVSITAIGDEGKSSPMGTIETGSLSDISINGGAILCTKSESLIKKETYVLQVKILHDSEIISIPITIKNIVKLESDKELFQYGFTINNPQHEAEIFVQKILLCHLLK